MKPLLALIALAGVLALSSVQAQDTAADQKAAAPAASTPTAAPAAAASAVAPSPPDRPVLISTDKLNSGDTAWMLASTALVLLMTIPGLALFYGGMVRKKNVLATLMQSFAITCLVTVLWVIVGYSIAFTPGTYFFGSMDRFFLNGMVFLQGRGESDGQPSWHRPSLSRFT